MERVTGCACNISSTPLVSMGLGLGFFDGGAAMQ
jgi:hypothetical protein